MRAGTLDQRISIERGGEGADAFGQRTLIWTEHVKVWANVNLQNGKASVASAREASVVSGSMRVRLRDDIAADMRVLWRGQIFDIKAVIPRPNGQKDCMDLVVETGANNG